MKQAWFVVLAVIFSGPSACAGAAWCRTTCTCIGLWLWMGGAVLEVDDLTAGPLEITLETVSL